jgi:6-phosphogluconolactonase
MQRRFFVGGYTKGFPGMPGQGRGISCFDFDDESGACTFKAVSGEIANPSYLAIDKSGKYLFAVSEVMEDQGPALHSFAVGPDGSLEQLSKGAVQGGLPCHLSLNDAGTLIATATYMGGTLEVFPVAAGGVIGERSHLFQQSGTGPNAARQERAHMHCALFVPGRDEIDAVDLGIDSLMRFRVEPEDGMLVDRFVTKPGSGPRHLARTADGRVGVLVSELDETVRLLHRRDDGWHEVAVAPAFPMSAPGDGACAAVKLSADARFAYVSGRRQNAIAVFEIGESELKRLGDFASSGMTPRDFTIDPTGRFFLVANQNSDDIVVIDRDPDTGLVGAVRTRVPCGSPVCVVFVGEG